MSFQELLINSGPTAGGNSNSNASMNGVVGNGANGYVYSSQIMPMDSANSQLLGSSAAGNALQQTINCYYS
jgi:hypothetical protein